MKITETRTNILKATLDLLEAGGGNGVRMTDIAKQAGISRQAVYLHFSTRAELLIAATQYVDELKGVEERLAESRSAQSGLERLDAYIDAWGNYIPEIYNIAKALLAMSDTDDEAAKAWDDRMQAMRHGCQAVIKQLKADGKLSSEHTAQQATDILWTMLSVRNWEQLRNQCNWSQRMYLKKIKVMAVSALVSK